MTTLQVEIAELMLATHAGRAILQLIEPARGAHVAAEAVSQGMRQMRHQTCGLKVLDALAASLAGRQREDFIEDDLALADESAFRVLFEQWGARTQIVAPLNRDGVLIGAIHLHRAGPPGHWSDSDRDALDQARRTISEQLDSSTQRALPISASGLRDAAIQTLLDGLRDGLDVQRCTLRRNVSQAYAFPVIYESRAAQINSLLGDFTIIQSSQPVIHKLLAERSQVVQDDCAGASDDPLFHAMLAHYGGLTSQIVTPLFRDDALAAVLSVHSLNKLRSWSAAEIAFARDAASLMGQLIGAVVQ